MTVGDSQKCNNSFAESLPFSLSLQLYCGGEPPPFVSGSKCSIGVAGTVSTCISSSLTEGQG